MMLASIAALCALIITGNARGQEIEGPTQPEYDLYTGCCYDTREFDSENRNERERSTESDRDRLEDDAREQLLRDLPDFCIITPVPIDDRYIGCLIHFQPEPARVDRWK